MCGRRSRLLWRRRWPFLWRRHWPLLVHLPTWRSGRLIVMPVRLDGCGVLSILDRRRILRLVRAALFLIVRNARHLVARLVRLRGLDWAVLILIVRCLRRLVGRPIWLLLNGLVGPVLVMVVRRAWSLIRRLAWLLLNRLVGPVLVVIVRSTRWLTGLLHLLIRLLVLLLIRPVPLLLIRRRYRPA